MRRMICVLIAALAACSRSDGQPKAAATAASAQAELVPEGTAAPAPDDSDANEPVTICHYPPGRRDKPRTIVVDADAVLTHLQQHGDTISACGPCVPTGNACSSTASCCGGSCDDSGLCADAAPECTFDGNACTSDGACCSGLCGEGVCGEPACIELTEACTSSAQCCSSFCDESHTCAPVPVDCLPTGSACTLDSPCCSGICGVPPGVDAAPSCLDAATIVRPPG